MSSNIIGYVSDKLLSKVDHIIGNFQDNKIKLILCHSHCEHQLNFNETESCTGRNNMLGNEREVLVEVIQ